MTQPQCTCIIYIGDNDTCPLHAAVCSCGAHYVLGVNGTIKGCDRCQHIIRNIDGLIIPQYA